ncbi:MAG TPA: sigma-54 dependent transcriptional regulator [Thermoanaerobaculia bacterium]|nr:sigma-54 dependent transcriptional regulator [Thermoanaerobaculia bacterium]
MILIADDDPSVVASLGLLLKRHGHATVGALSQEEALRHLEKEGEGIGLVLQDMNFSRGTGGEEGLELLREIRRRRPQLPVILITAWGSIALAVEGMKAGAADFVTKPWSNPQILQSVDTALSLARSGDAKAAPSSREELDRRFDFRGLIGRDSRFLKILELIGRVAPTDASVLITGESGTGKELVAEALHRNSRRKGGPFVKVNLGGISSTLFESEMFGHVKGAFTDARTDRKGRFEMAHAGTIFLDEIGEIDPSAQVKLLRVLQDRSYEVLGSSITRTVDVRVIAATNRDLGEQVAKGQFREDLLYRLNLIAIHLPPLRERRGDVPVLARHFLGASAQVYRRGAEVAISDKALDWLQGQSWPGNIRQLKQTLERAVLVLDGDVLEVEDLRALSDLETRAARDPNALPSPGSMTLDEIEKAMIVKCLRHYEGNVTRVAEALGLSRAALYRRFEKYGLEP